MAMTPLDEIEQELTREIHDLMEENNLKGHIGYSMRIAKAIRKMIVASMVEHKVLVERDYD